MSGSCLIDCSLDPNTTRSDNGLSCVCKAGYERNGSDVCVWYCLDIPHSHPVGQQCICDTGYTADVSGYCRRVCGTYATNSDLYTCECNAGFVFISGSCVDCEKDCSGICHSHPV